MRANKPRTNPAYRLSMMAERDLENILDYTVDTWGKSQADQYLKSIEECFLGISRMPELGRSCKSLHPGLRRMEHKKHVVFYMLEADSVFIARILHESMLPMRHNLMDKERG